MSYKRSKLEIYLEALKTINEGSEKPTRIMYETNLSWKPLVMVLGSLQDQGLITGRKKGSHIIYHVTEKGENVLKYLNEVMDLIEIK